MYITKKDKVAAVFSYLGWIFWIVAFIIRSKNDQLSRRHLNQGLILNVIGSVAGILTRFHGLIGIAGDVLGICVFVLAIMGIVRAVQERYEPLPVIGEIDLL